MRNRLALQYAVEGDLRFISHHDSLRLFERALARAGLPVSCSQGFNPRPRIRIALPRPVGVASLDELLVVELASQVTYTEVLSRLSSQLPPGITLLTVETLKEGDRRLPCEASYSVDIEPSLSEQVKQRVARFMSRQRIEVERIAADGRSSKSVDIRQYVLTMNVKEGRLDWSQSIAASGTARVTELIEAVGLSSCHYLHRLRREKVSYQT